MNLAYAANSVHNALRSFTRGKKLIIATISRPTGEEQADEGVLLFVLLFWKEMYRVFNVIG